MRLSHTRGVLQARLITELVKEDNHALADEYCRGWDLDAGAFEVQTARIRAQVEREATQYLQLPIDNVVRERVAYQPACPQAPHLDTGLPADSDRVQQQSSTGRVSAASSRCCGAGH